jgi:hypothetical protein
LRVRQGGLQARRQVDGGIDQHWSADPRSHLLLQRPLLPRHSRSTQISSVPGFHRLAQPFTRWKSWRRIN